MAERRATPRARLTISCLESEWERIREVADLRVLTTAKKRAYSPEFRRGTLFSADGCAPPSQWR